MKLRDYQQAALDKVAAAFERGQYSGIVHFATGLGKTETAFGAYQRFVDPRWERAIFVAPSRALIYQTAERAKRALPFLNQGVMCAGQTRPGIGVVMGTHNEPRAAFIIGSVQTLIDRSEGCQADHQPIQPSDVLVYDRQGHYVSARLNPQSPRSVLISKRMDEVLQYGVPSLLMFDEAHHAVADNSFILIKRLQQLRTALKLPPLKLIGFTATPIRADGRGLINLFERVYARADFRWGQRHGYLVPFADPIRVVVETPEGCISPLRCANWEEEIYKAYCKLASERFCIGFVGPIGDLGGVEVSRALTYYFQQRGVPCAQTDGDRCILPSGEEAQADRRGEIYDAFMRGNLRVIFSFGVGLEGLDLPRADCLLWMRATDNSVLRTQAVGRILRLYPDKKDALIIDFTDRALELEPIGTLLGYKVDPITQRYINDEESPEEADTLLEGLTTSLRQPSQASTTYHQQYERAHILVRQSNDWYDGGNYMTLPVNEREGLLIVSPHYRLGEVVRVCLNDVYRAQNGEPNPYNAASNRVYHNFYTRLSTVKDTAELERFLAWADSFLNNYTLWVVQINRFQSSLRDKGFIECAPTLEDILFKAAIYMDEQMTATKAFTKKSQRWKQERDATPAQLQALRALGYNVNGRLSCGEASQQISHILLTRPIEPVVERLYKKIEEIIFNGR